MSAEGISTQPIQKLTGEYGFTETFFTDARIPADCIMGEEGQGWRIAMQTLQYERGAEAGAAGGISILSIVMNDLLKMAAKLNAKASPCSRTRSPEIIWSSYSSKRRPCIWRKSV